MVIWVVAIVTDGLIAYGLTLLGRTFSWYTRPVWIVMLYIGPTIAVSFFITMYSANRYRKVSR